MMKLAKIFRSKCLFLAPSVLLALSASASELVYTPVNPTFGGNPANAPGLQANASAQNDFKAPSTAKTPLQRFNDQLQAAVLSRLSSNALIGLFDDKNNLLTDGTVTAGNYEIRIKTTDNGIELTTSDRTVPGSSTTILVGNVPD